MGTAWKTLIGLGFAATTVWSFRVPGAQAFPEPDLARIVFWHLPCAFATVVFLLAGAIHSLRTIRSGSGLLPDWKAQATQELALVFGLITMATGILFSRAQWGAWWSWDPRQTSFLFVLLILLAYFAVRAAFSDPARRAANAAAFALAAVLPLLFLIFVLPRLPQVEAASLHPSQTLPKGLLRGEYLYLTLANFALFTLAGAWLARMRVRASEREWNLDNNDGQLDDGGGSAAHGVVRPVSVPDESG
jgi:heme exporter protein C